MADFDTMMNAADAEEVTCDICRYFDECGGNAVSGGPNGPIYAPCTDNDPRLWVDEGFLEEWYRQHMEEVSNAE